MPQAEHIRSAENLLRLVRAETDSIGVAVSFGKDSLAVLDLCCQLFRRVEGYYLFRVRDLEIVEGWADQVKKRHGVTVRKYPHFDLVRCYRASVLQTNFAGAEETKKISMADIERQFRKDVGVDWIAYGWRRNDSFSRAMIMKRCAGYDSASRRIFPIRAWSRKLVLDYLAERGIPMPPGLGRKDQGGLDFHPEALAELKEKHPADWAKWQRDFPLSGIQCLSRGEKGFSPPANRSMIGNATTPQAEGTMVPRNHGRHQNARVPASDSLLAKAAGGTDI